MLFTSQSAGIYGIDAHLIKVEVEYTPSRPTEQNHFQVVGLPDPAVRESGNRVRAALKNSGISITPAQIDINLAPADHRKVGPGFDLPIAVGILGAYGALEINEMSRFLFVGELGMDGSVRAVHGVFPVAVLAREKQIENLIVPAENALEAGFIKGVNIYPVSSLREVLDLLNNQHMGKVQCEPFRVDYEALLRQKKHITADFKDVRGHHTAKRALEVAAAGSHNIMMIGPPGSGKTMMAELLPTILPQLSYDEALEITKIHSVAGVLNPQLGLIQHRPFRSPHHSVSDVGLIGGGTFPRPGEISLAHNGVLFLDELPEFHHNALEGMRQPLEERRVTIVRASGSVVFPANFMLAAAVNPCPCGYLNDNSRECSCTPQMIQRYAARISGPLLDRIDIHVEVPSLRFNQLHGEQAAEGSAEIGDRVLIARQHQLQRFQDLGENIYSNAQMTTRHVRAFCKLKPDAERVLGQAMQRYGLTARGHDRILKIARTIADLESAEFISDANLAEAVMYRTFDRNYGT